MGLYGLAAGSAPALAPIISGFAVEAESWRWAFWEMLWLSGFTLIVVVISLPEVGSCCPLLLSPIHTNFHPPRHPLKQSSSTEPNDSENSQATIK
jgi:MFS family permease